MSQAFPPIEPRKSLDTEPYWQGCREGRLMYQLCAYCGEVVFHARSHCPYCLTADPEWTASAGRGSVYSCSVQHFPLRGESKNFPPRALGIVLLDEGFYMFTEFIMPEGTPPRIDDRVEVLFEKLSDETTLPKFRSLK